jgi:futalosine hydrolase
MKTLALLSSMPFENDQILSHLKNVRKTEIAGRPAHKGVFEGINIILPSMGIGKVNSAITLTAVLENFSVSTVINVGVGGAYPGSGLMTGDIATASQEIYGDEGVIDSRGWHSLKKIGIPLLQEGRKQYFNEYPVTPLPLPLRNKRSEIEIAAKIKSGIFVTVSSCSGSMKRAKELEKRFNAICENMEGAALAHVCALYKIPFHEIRGISNIVGVRDKRKWNLKLASTNCQRVVLETLHIIITGKAL